MSEGGEAQRPRRRRRRGARGRRRGHGGAPDQQRQPAARPEQRDEARPDPTLPDWNWRTLPVMVAFALGIVLMGIIVAVPPIDTWLFILGLLGVSFGAAHMFSRQWVARRNARRRGQ